MGKTESVMGWTCSYIPEEIIHAAGFRPLRVLGNGGASHCEGKHAPSNYCSFIQNCTDALYNGEYDFLDGIVLANSCHAMEFLFDAWRSYAPDSFVHMLDVPKIVGKEAENLFAQRIRELIKQLELFFRIKITTEALATSIAAYNITRKLFQRIYTLRRNPDVGVQGRDLAAIINRIHQLSIPEIHCELEDLAERHDPSRGLAEQRGKKRVMLIGSVVANNRLTDMIEKENAVVVFENSCDLYRYIDQPIEEECDPILAISRRYLNKTRCPRMGSGNRIGAEDIGRIIEDYQIDGIVYHAFKYCSIHSIHALTLKEQILDTGIPFLFVEGSYGMREDEQMRTRVGTFIDML